jgi:2-oxoglutarate dehydrogenase E2 component (dihydrolipoamide succinyltransferase)
MAVSVQMPALGESVTEGTVTRWLKQEGDTVVADEPLLEVSTDKVDTEIPAPASGVLTKILAHEDDTVAVGGELAIIGDAGEQTEQIQRVQHDDEHREHIFPEETFVEQIFERVKESLSTDYLAYTRWQPYFHAVNASSVCLDDPKWSFAEKYDTIMSADIKFDDVLKFSKVLLRNSHMEVK